MIQNLKKNYFMYLAFPIWSFQRYNYIKIKFIGVSSQSGDRAFRPTSWLKDFHSRNRHPSEEPLWPQLSYPFGDRAEGSLT